MGDVELKLAELFELGKTYVEELEVGTSEAADKAERDADALFCEVSAMVTALRAENAKLRSHYDAAAPEHNLLALLDLYHDRECAAVRENAKLRACIGYADILNGWADVSRDSAVRDASDGYEAARAALDSTLKGT